MHELPVRGRPAFGGGGVVLLVLLSGVTAASLWGPLTRGRAGAGAAPRGVATGGQFAMHPRAAQAGPRDQTTLISVRSAAGAPSRCRGLLSRLQLGACGTSPSPSRACRARRGVDGSIMSVPHPAARAGSPVHGSNAR